MNPYLPNNKIYYLLLLISIFISVNLYATEKSECLNDAKAPEVIKNEKGFYILKGRPLVSQRLP